LQHAAGETSIGNSPSEQNVSGLKVGTPDQTHTTHPNPTLFSPHVHKNRKRETKVGRRRHDDDDVHRPGSCFSWRDTQHTMEHEAGCTPQS
jgi:hypothetical protein